MTEAADESDVRPEDDVEMPGALARIDHFHKNGRKPFRPLANGGRQRGAGGYVRTEFRCRPPQAWVPAFFCDDGKSAGQRQTRPQGHGHLLAEVRHRF